MPKPIEVTDQTFQTLVIANSLPVLVDFWATWCPPCRMIAPFIEELAADYDGRIVVCKVDVDNNQGIAQKYNVRSIPTLLFFKNGEVKDQIIGAKPKDEIAARLNALL